MANVEHNSISQYIPVYSVEQEKLIEAEFSRLKDQCYLEHAGTTLYSEKQISSILLDLTNTTYGNPHARNISSKLAEDAVDQIRFQILRFFNTNPDDYSVIFTSGATGALKLVAETFQYENISGEQGTFAYLESNHTSVLGMREYLKKSIAISHEDAYKFLSNDDHLLNKECERNPSQSNGLFVYPAQCNFSGTKHALAWIERVQRGALSELGLIKSQQNWFCMLDAASYVSTNFLDLSKYKPDFVCLSFYKIFGYPTGLGALLVRNSSAYVLKKRYFGGGTVLMAISSVRTHIPRTVLHESFEDGTIPFLSIIALKHGFDTFERFSLRMTDISKHTFSLAQYVFRYLSRLHHGNGNPVAILYSDTNFDDIDYQGAIINFNLLKSNGEYVGYSEVLHLANLFSIHLRTGCFCNPGACRRHLQLSVDDVIHHYNSGHVCGDQNDLVNGYPTGSVRISFGYMSTRKDADTFLKMVEECFVTKPIVQKIPQAPQRNPINGYCGNSKDRRPMKIQSNAILNGNFEDNGVLEQIFIYPIKSCGPFKIKNSWKLSTTGFQYDRQWMIINSSGVCMTQKNNNRMCLIEPTINLDSDSLELRYKGSLKGNRPLTVPLNDINSVSLVKCQSKVCGDKIQGWDCGNEAGSWLSEVLGLPGLRLLRQCNNLRDSRIAKRDEKLQLSLVNKAQFLLINMASVQWLMDCISVDDRDNSLQDLIDRFRPNLVINVQQSLIENTWTKIKIGNCVFKCDSQCNRCQMICINQSTGEKSAEPLRTLSKEFNGKISFGVYLSNVEATECTLKLQDLVTGYKT